jgi:predicted ribosome quality control (RQC) complex YloA/Tae2 family protein
MVKIEYNGYNVYYGRNAKENWELIDNCEENDIWFHIDDYPSSHVILEVCDDTDISSDLYEYCCKLCVECTPKMKRKNVSRVLHVSHVSHVKVIYTNCGNIRKGKVVGEVYIENVKLLNYKIVKLESCKI